MTGSIGRNCSLHVRWLNDSKFLQQLAEDNIDIDIINKELDSEQSSRKQTRIQKIILSLLQCYPMQILIAILVLIDAGIVIAEIVLEIHSMKNKIEAYSEQMRDTIHFLNNTYIGTPVFNNYDIQILEEPSSSHKELDLLSHILPLLPQSISNFQLPNELNCSLVSAIKDKTKHKHGHQEVTFLKQHRSSNLHKASEMLHFASIGLLGLFVIELTVKILCIGPTFFQARFEVIDAIVILTSFFADIIIIVIGSQELSVMIIFLLWRIVRVINGLVMHEKQRDEFRIFLQKKSRRISEMKLEELVIRKEMQDKHCIGLEEMCIQARVSPEIIQKCRPKFTPITKCHTNNPLKSIAALTSGFMGTIAGVHATNKFIQKFVFHSNSASPVLNNKTPQSPITFSSENNSINTTTPNCNHKFLFVDTLSPPKDESLMRKYRSHPVIRSENIKESRFVKKRVYKCDKYKDIENISPDHHSNYLIETFISSPLVHDDNEQKE